MSIETILKPWRYIDEQILRYYTKVSERHELNDGKTKYLYGIGLNLCAVVSCGIGIGNYLLSHYPAEQCWDKFKEIRWGWVSIKLPDVLHNYFGIMGWLEEGNKKESGTKNLLDYVCNRINCIPRLPLFFTGIGGLGYSLVELCQGDITGSEISACLGLGALAHASSIYIKAADPKLLDKAPFWKSAYNWIKDKVGSLFPTPEPGYLLRVQLD